MNIIYRHSAIIKLMGKNIHGVNMITENHLIKDINELTFSKNLKKILLKYSLCLYIDIYIFMMSHFVRF